MQIFDLKIITAFRSEIFPVFDLITLFSFFLLSSFFFFYQKSLVKTTWGNLEIQYNQDLGEIIEFWSKHGSWSTFAKCSYHRFVGTTHYLCEENKNIPVMSEAANHLTDEKGEGKIIFVISQQIMYNILRENSLPHHQKLAMGRSGQIPISKSFQHMMSMIFSSNKRGIM